eukprot:7118354-Lingulodinium_polyedra.AAC.1
MPPKTLLNLCVSSKVLHAHRTRPAAISLIGLVRSAKSSRPNAPPNVTWSGTYPSSDNFFRTSFGGW